MGEFEEVKALLDRYYAPLIDAMVDYELELSEGHLDVPPLMHQASSFLVEYLGGDQAALSKAGGCLCQALLLYRKAIYSGRMKRLIALIRQDLAVVEPAAFPAEIARIGEVRSRLNQVIENEPAWERTLDWENLDQRYQKVAQEAEELTWEMDTLLANLRSRML